MARLKAEKKYQIDGFETPHEPIGSNKSNQGII